MIESPSIRVVVSRPVKQLRAAAVRRYPPFFLPQPLDFQFGLITMIGDIFEQDMLYEEVKEKLRAHKKQHLPKTKIFLPIMEETHQNEDDSDFDELPPRRHPADNQVFNKTLARINRRIQFFRRESISVSNYPLKLIEESILQKKKFS